MDVLGQEYGLYIFLCGRCLGQELGLYSFLCGDVLGRELGCQVSEWRCLVSNGVMAFSVELFGQELGS